MGKLDGKVALVADAAVLMACQPPDVNILEIIQLPKDQPYLGRG